MAGQPKNPVVAGILSGILPGLGQFYCRQWGKGAGFLVGALVVDGLFGFTLGTIAFLCSFGSPASSEIAVRLCAFGSPVPVFKLLLGSLLLLAIVIWSIADAVRAAQGSQL